MDIVILIFLVVKELYDRNLSISKKFIIKFIREIG